MLTRKLKHSNSQLLKVQRLKKKSVGHIAAIQTQYTSISRISRRIITVGSGATAAALGVLALAGAAAAASSFSSSKDPRTLIQSGMMKFRKNDVEGSVVDFDSAIALSPELRPYMWQRGLSLYYLKEFQAGAEQFRVDVAVNPNDTEEAIWAFLCEAALVGTEQARQQFLLVGRDSRPVMRAAYEAFQLGSSPEAMRAAIRDNEGHDAFYGQLYIGLWYEAHGKLDEAQVAILSAVATPYAKVSGDYMVSVAKVHCLRRKWQ